ncbi:MAG: Yip1 family protein [Myxococcota bacterium]
MSNLAQTADECPSHPGQIALGRCLKCSRPTCSYCEEAGSELCPSCRSQDDGGGVIAWERRELPLLRRFARTVADVLRQPGVVFLRMKAGSVSLALGFITMFSILVFLLMLLVASVAMAFGLLSSGTGSAGAEMITILVVAVFMLPAIAIGTPLTCTGLGVLHFVAVAMVGGQASFERSVRAASYASVVGWIFVFLPFVAAIPVVGPIASGAMFLFFLFFLGVAFANIGEGAMGLRGGKAWLAGFVPPLLVLLLLVAFVALGMSGPEPNLSPDYYG